MSLRFRLILIYTALLSSVVLLLSIVVSSMVSVVIVDLVDDHLQETSDQIMNALRADAIGGLDINPAGVKISNDIYYQVWSTDHQLLIYSDNANDFTSPMDSEGISQEQTRYTDVDINETAYRVLTVPLQVDEEHYGWLQVGRTMNDLRYTQRLLLIVFGISAVYSILVAVFFGWIVTGQALEPLQTMAKIAQRITNSDDLSKRIPVNPNRNDEISSLVLTINQTLVRLERLFNNQRRFLADVSHELRTPLTVIKGNVGLMRMMKTFDQESLDSIESEVDRLTRLVGDLLLMAQAETGQMPLMMESVALDDLVFEVYEEMQVLSEGRQTIRIGDIEPVVVMGDRDRLKQVILNIGGNAVKFSPDGSQILLNLSVHQNWVQISVHDEGPGIKKPDLDHLFERFYRRDKARTRNKKQTGFGLGLTIAYWIVRNHGGHIDVETEEGTGSTFSVWLPVS